jgi:transcription antitermination factor NusG
MKKRIISGLLTGVMALSLAACGSSTDNAGAAVPEASGAADQKAEATAAAGESASTHIYVLTAPEDHGWTGSVATFAKEKVEEVKIFPSYVFIKMVMTDESWHAVRNITGVTGFVGPGSRPTPLSEQEVADMSIESAEEVKVQLAFKEGDEVSIVGGLFEGYEGVVQNISEDLKTVTVLVKRGRRDMPVEIEAEVLKLKTQI